MGLRGAVGRNRTRAFARDTNAPSVVWSPRRPGVSAFIAQPEGRVLGSDVDLDNRIAVDGEVTNMTHGISHRWG